MIKNNQFYPKKDNFMIEFGVQHIEINYLHVKRFLFSNKHLTGAFYASKNDSMPKKSDFSQIFLLVNRMGW